MDAAAERRIHKAIPRSTMSGPDHEAEVERQRAKRDIQRELADDHYRRTCGVRLKELAGAMRAEVAASPGVIRLDHNHCCHLCGTAVGDEAQSARNPHLFICVDCRAKFGKKS